MSVLVARPVIVAIAVQGATSEVPSWSPVVYKSRKLDNSAEVDKIDKSHRVGKLMEIG